MKDRCECWPLPKLALPSPRACTLLNSPSKLIGMSSYLVFYYYKNITVDGRHDNYGV